MNRRDVAWLVLLGALWGAVYPLTSVVLETLPPAAVVMGRTALAGVVLVPLVWRAGATRVLAARPAAVAGAALLQATIPLVLLTTGQRHVQAAVAGIVLASQPVWTVVITAILDHRVRARAAVGVVVGLAGVALLFAGDLHTQGTTLAGGLLLVGAAACFAGGTVYIERVVPEVPALPMAAAAMATSALVLAPFAVAAHPPRPDPSTTGWLVVLGVVATGGALVLFYALIQDIGAVRANLAGYLAPGFAIGYGLVLLDESVSTTDLVGLAVILAGTYLAGRAPTATPAPRRVPR